MRAMGLGLTAVVAALAPACFSSTGTSDCTHDRDCSGLVCTRVGDCVAQSGIYALRIDWTVHGLTTDDVAACADVGELELAIEDPASGDLHTVRPVPCAAGRFNFDKLPRSFTEVTLTAYDPGGAFLDSGRASAVGAAGVVQISLLP